MLLLFSAELKMKYFFKILLFLSDCDIRGTGGQTPTDHRAGQLLLLTQRRAGDSTAALARQDYSLFL